MADRHRVAELVCSRSNRIEKFFSNEGAVLVRNNYCRAFVFENPQDPSEVWGFYTLSAALLAKDSFTNSDEKRLGRQTLGYPAPMARIGFMGRSDRAPSGLGAGLLVDAARRVHRIRDIAIWGLVLEPEGGPENSKLWNWYLKQGFKPCRMPAESRFHSVYGPLSVFIPELSRPGTESDTKKV